MIFRTLNPEKIWHANLTDLSTSPVRRSHFTFNTRNKHSKSAYIKVLQEKWRDGVVLFHLNATVDNCKRPILLNALLVFWPVLATFHSTALHHSAPDSINQHAATVGWSSV